ncbi:MAG: acyl-CoA thioesterase [Aquificaceae bacterium]|nr:acyl-CoA thioesterase [Aquificaceae bacterium]
MFVYRRRVQFYETDAQGVVHHSNYFKYFEEARGELFRHLGCPYSRLREGGFEVVLIYASCQFSKPIRYDEEFELGVGLVHIDRFSFSFDYRIVSLDILKARGSTKHCVLKDGRIVSIPSEVKTKLTEFFLGPCKR